ncbi:MAG: AmmeMemoRadiSam system protein A [Candidatus Moranbacteria bacterium RBG_13_45_13]|nr:MAG: AmmeMemoRadiSam system protein A [Candidatus Moranbacteria bacterium RBG_13_45_13]
MSRYVSLAEKAIEKYLKTGEILPAPNDLPPEFYEKKGGVFVSIHKNKELRGCVGTYLPAHENLAEEIILNAVAACSKDSRFSPLAAEELPALSVEVSLLSVPEKVSSLKELDPKEYGVIVKCPDGRCGLLLPDLKGVGSVEQQLSIACQKGGINPITEKDMEIYKFSIEKHSQ